jgi:hypothetical protein
MDSRHFKQRVINEYIRDVSQKCQDVFTYPSKMREKREQLGSPYR